MRKKQNWSNPVTQNYRVLYKIASNLNLFKAVEVLYFIEIASCLKDEYLSLNLKVTSFYYNGKVK